MRLIAPRGLDERRAVLVAGTVSAVMHLLMMGSLPLVLTPDGGEYVRAALSLSAEPAIPANRTPGYPLLLAATFAVFGVGAGGVLVVQNLIGTATCMLLTWAACGLARPALALAVGLVFALDPWFLGFSNYVLTETATTFFLMLAAALALRLHRARSRGAAAVAIGVAIAAACLMRPAIQATAPFLGAAWVLGVRATVRRRAALAVVAALAFATACAPWLAYNAARGVRGFASGSGWVLWYGVTMFGFLDRANPPDPATGELTERLLAGGVSDYPVMRVILDSDAIESEESGAVLRAWALQSIRERPLTYVASIPGALLWQLNAGIAGWPPMYDELPFFLERLGWDTHHPPRAPAPNFQNAGEVPRWWAFAVSWHGGFAQAYLRWAAGALRGIPQVPLFLCTVVAGALAAWRREWPALALFAAPLVFILLHAALLQPLARHAIPPIALAYLALAYLLELAAGRRGADALPSPARALAPA